jgi:ABC-type oligopeptide transport system substrate-binding subunit
MKKGHAKNFVVVICLVLVAAILSLAGACSSPPAAGSVLKVGMITPSTGPAAEKGAPMGDAILDAFEYINKSLKEQMEFLVELVSR